MDGPDGAWKWSFPDAGTSVLMEPRLYQGTYSDFLVAQGEQRTVLCVTEKHILLYVEDFIPFYATDGVWKHTSAGGEKDEGV